MRLTRYDYPSALRALGAFIGVEQLLGSAFGAKPSGSLLAFAGTCILVRNLVGSQERRNEGRRVRTAQREARIQAQADEIGGND